MEEEEMGAAMVGKCKFEGKRLRGKREVDKTPAREVRRRFRKKDRGEGKKGRAFPNTTGRGLCRRMQRRKGFWFKDGSPLVLHVL